MPTPLDALRTNQARAQADRQWNADVASRFNTALEHLVEARCPKSGDQAIRQAAFDELRDVVERTHGLELAPYGSWVSGFLSSSSDLDLALTGTRVLADMSDLVAGNTAVYPAVDITKSSTEERKTLLKSVIREFEARGVVTAVEEILGARVPIIRFRHASSNIECDLCVAQFGTTFKNQVIREVACIEPRFEKLFRLVKLWARAHDLNDGHLGTFNSWCLTLLVLFSLQVHQDNLLPPLRILFSRRDGSRLFNSQHAVDLISELRYCQRECRRHASIDRSSSSRNGSSRKGNGSSRNDSSINGSGQNGSTSGNGASSGAGYPSSPDGSSLGDDGRSLLELLHHFIVVLDFFVGGWASRYLGECRVCVWEGNAQRRSFNARYLALVEDPFDFHDNAARNLGAAKHDPGTLQFAKHITGVTNDALRLLREPSDAQRTFLYMFGPGAFTCLPRDVVLDLLQVSGSTMDRVESMPETRRFAVWNEHLNGDPILSWEDWQEGLGKRQQEQRERDAAERLLAREQEQQRRMQQQKLQQQQEEERLMMRLQLQHQQRQQEERLQQQQQEERLLQQEATARLFREVSQIVRQERETTVPPPYFPQFRQQQLQQQEAVAFALRPPPPPPQPRTAQPLPHQEQMAEATKALQKMLLGLGFPQQGI